MPTSANITYPQPKPRKPLVGEQGIEDAFIEKLRSLKYADRPDIHDRAALELNFRQKFESLNRVRLTDGEFQRLLDELITPDVFTAARVLREKKDFTRDDGTPLSYTLVNIRDWCKNDFEVVHQLRINTDYSHHRYDVILLINGVPVAQIELKTLGVSPRRAMEQVVEYKNDPGNGYTRTLLCFIQLFIVSNRTETFYFANNNARHFAFNAAEQFLPVYRFANLDNTPVPYLDDFADRFLQKCTLGRMVSRYMVLIQSEQKLLIMMRPYQIYAVQAIVADYNTRYGANHTVGEFDLYYQDVQKRIKDQKFPNAELPEPTATGQDTPQVTAQVTAQVAAQVEACCREQPQPAKAIMAALGLRHWKTFQASYLLPLLQAGILERTLPDKPNSRLQKYRLTEKGRAMVEGGKA